MEEGSCDLSDVSYLVLDEADRMLDQGFERDVRKIIAATDLQRQTCLISATWPEPVSVLAHEFLKKPIKNTIGSDNLTAGSTIPHILNIKYLMSQASQTVEKCPQPSLRMVWYLARRRSKLLPQISNIPC